MSKICDECETVAHCTKHGCVPKQQALDKMAENAREIGIQMQPEEPRAWFTIDELNAWADKKLKENPQWAEQPAQQEPVAWMTKTGSVWKTKADETDEPLYTSPPAQRKPLPDGIPSPDELEALSDGNSGMIFNTGFPTKLDRLACWLREYAAIEAAHGIKEST